MPPSHAHIAGVGIAAGTPNTDIEQLAIAAATKAQLDAGITYRNVGLSIASSLNAQSRIPRSSFEAFGAASVPVIEAASASALVTAVQYVKSGQVECALLVGIDKDASRGGAKEQVLAIAVVLVSDLFLRSRAYLKDQAICIRGCALGSSAIVPSALRQARLSAKELQLVETTASSAGSQALNDIDSAGLSEQSSVGSTGLAGLCGIVYRLRGWSDATPTGLKNCLQIASSPEGSEATALVLSRSDEQQAPKWSEIENVRDGRERLGYNPAMDVRQIASEDLAAVQAGRDLGEATMAIEISGLTKKLQLPVKGGDRAALARL